MWILPYSLQKSNSIPQFAACKYAPKRYRYQTLAVLIALWQYCDDVADWPEILHQNANGMFKEGR